MGNEQQTLPELVACLRAHYGADSALATALEHHGGEQLAEEFFRYGQDCADSVFDAGTLVPIELLADLIATLVHDARGQSPEFACGIAQAVTRVEQLIDISIKLGKQRRSKGN